MLRVLNAKLCSYLSDYINTTYYVLRNLLGKGQGGRDGGAAQNEGKEKKKSEHRLKEKPKWH